MDSTAAVKRRPKHLDLLKIKQPVPAILSILHRVSGALLAVVGIPVILGLLGASLRSEQGFAGVADFFGNPLVKLITLGFVWLYVHHFLAGIRYLLLDVHKGIDLESARRSSQIVLGLGVVLTVLIGVKLW